MDLNIMVCGCTEGMSLIPKIEKERDDFTWIMWKALHFL